MDDICVACGAYVPEGSMICKDCSDLSKAKPCQGCVDRCPTPNCHDRCRAHEIRTKERQGYKTKKTEIVKVQQYINDVKANVFRKNVKKVRVSYKPDRG
jgi:hypothetical protein